MAHYNLASLVWQQTAYPLWPDSDEAPFLKEWGRVPFRKEGGNVLLKGTGTRSPSPEKVEISPPWVMLEDNPQEEQREITELKVRSSIIFKEAYQKARRECYLTPRSLPPETGNADSTRSIPSVCNPL